MKISNKLLSDSCGRNAALAMQCVCYLIIIFMILCLVLSCMGRQTFVLHGDGEVQERAIYAEDDHGKHPRNLTVHSGDDIHVWTNEENQIDILTQVGLSLMYAVHTIPAIAAYWLLSRVFSNVYKGRIFVERNAHDLLGFAVLQFVIALGVPVIKFFVRWIINLISRSPISISTGQDMLQTIFWGIGFLAAAYIIQKGIPRNVEEAEVL